MQVRYGAGGMQAVTLLVGLQGYACCFGYRYHLNHHHYSQNPHRHPGLDSAL